MYVQYSDKTYLRLAAVSWFHRLQDKRTLCASAVAATSGTAASCRPNVYLALFLAPTLSLSLSLSLSAVGLLAADAHLIFGILRNLPVASQHAGSKIVLHLTLGCHGSRWITL